MWPHKRKGGSEGLVIGVYATGIWRGGGCPIGVYDTPGCCSMVIVVYFQAGLPPVYLNHTSMVSPSK